jgi:hypothetical protein
VDSTCRRQLRICSAVSSSIASYTAAALCLICSNVSWWFAGIVAVRASCSSGTAVILMVQVSALVMRCSFACQEAQLGSAVCPYRISGWAEHVGCSRGSCHT